MKRLVLSPNPYRDKGFRVLRAALEVLRENGMEGICALPFESDQMPEMPRDITFMELPQALEDADALICFGGDGTILHCAREATLHGVPILGINVGNVGFMAELESGDVTKGELQLQQWRSKAVTDTYEPGSTYKILTLSAALEEIAKESK